MVFKSLLEREFLKRKNTNPSYSIRAFARDLAVDQSALSRILSGQRKATEKLVKRVASRLDLSSEELAKCLIPESLTKVDVRRYETVALSSFLVVSEWYHDAILELLQVKNFQPDPKWIAEQLGLDIVTVNLALQRLREVGWLAEDEKGQWVDCSENNVLLADGETHPSLQQYQKQVLKNSERALLNVDPQQRSHTSLTIAVNQNQLAQAKELIHRFRRELGELLSDNRESRDAVYQIQIGVYPLTQKEIQK